MTLAEKIKQDIKKKGLKQYAVADRAGIDRQFFYQLLNGRRKFDVSYLAPICKALGTSPNISIHAPRVGSDLGGLR